MKWNKIALSLLLLVSLFGVTASSQQTEKFSQFMNGLPTATSPLGSGDKFYVLQGGVSKAVTAPNLPATPCALATSSTFGCVKPDNGTVTINSGVLTAVIPSTGSGGLGWINAQASPYNATGNGSTDDTAAIQAAIDAAYAGNIQTVYLPKPAICYKITAPLYLDPPGNLRSSLNSPTIFAFSLSLLGEPGGGNHEGHFGSRICPSTTGFVALYVGTGQGMRVSHITIEGVGGIQAAAYRCGRSTSEVGIYIAGGGGGASRTKIEDVMIENFYYSISVGLNNGNLGDSNSFEKIFLSNACVGIFFNSSQNFINDCLECNMSGVNVGVSTLQGTGMTAIGGNWSATNGIATGVMTLSGWSAFTATANGGNNDYSFTATLSAPAFDGTFSTNYVYGDVVSNAGQVWWCINFSPSCKLTTPSLGSPGAWEPIANYLGKALNAFDIVTTHFGVIPMTVASFTQATSSITLKMWGPWSFSYFPTNTSAFSYSDLQAEIQTGTTLYASEWVTVFQGSGIHATGVHVENPSVPTQLFQSLSFVNGAAGNVFNDIRTNFNPAAIGSIGGTPKQKAQFYASQTFPVITINNVSTDIHASALGNTSSATPIVVDANLGNGNNVTFKMDATNNGDGPLAMRAYGNDLSSTNNYFGFGWSPAFGFGVFELSPFGPENPGNPGTGLDGYNMSQNWGRSTFWGRHPAWNERPCITPAQLATLSGALPAWTNGGINNITFGYPFLWGGQIYTVCDWNVGIQTHYTFESTHRFYSMGQNITTTNVPTLSWSYKAQSVWVYADPQTLTLMFPGLCIILNDGSSDHKYIVTGVWRTLGYFTVVFADNSAGGNLSGATSTTVVTGNLIKQEAYSLVFP